MHVNLFTDGSSRGNPGRGGYGYILILPGKVVEGGGSDVMTTNNRMEMMAVLEGLKCFDKERDKFQSVTVCSDSEYLIKGITSWVSSWKRNGWKTSAKKSVLNQDLWQDLDKIVEGLTSEGIAITWKHVRGHAGVVLNERADIIATTFADKEECLTYKGEESLYKKFLEEQ